MLRRYHSMRIILQAVVENTVYKRWLSTQDTATKEKGAKVLLTVREPEHWGGGGVGDYGVMVRTMVCENQEFVFSVFIIY